MNDNNDTNQSGTPIESKPVFDDHEPGDVNGNVDPAWAKKQKQQTRQGEPRAPRPPRNAQSPQPQQPRSPRPARPPRAPREMRVAQDRDAVQPLRIDAAAGGDSGVVNVIAGDVPMPRVDTFMHDDSNANVSVAQISQNAGEQSAEAAQGSPEHAGERRIEHAGEQRPRGLRRNRRGARDQHSVPNSNANLRTVTLGQTNDFDAYQQNIESDGSPNLIGQPAEESHNPNPGAFGDPARPMDRSARRNRNRNRKQDDYVERVQKSEAVHAARALRVAAAQNADGTAPIEEAQELDRDGERLHKVLAQQGLGSRRAMESLIEAGEVEVNGKPAQVGQVVNERDRVFVKRRKVNIKLGDDNPRIMIYHKPAGEIVTRDDPEARDTVFDRLPRPDHGRWIAVGRLDYNTEGLLLFTTSGELANRMMHPRYEIMREYSVRIMGELTPEQEDALIDGIELDDGPARVLSLDRIDRDSEGANHWYRITINEGRNREVRRMFEHLGLTVSRLIRTRYGAVNMPSWLKRGQYKLLDENDTFNVLEVVGMRSRKKLEKAARFGGARGKIPQGPIGPMRSSTEQNVAWSGAPAAGVGAGGQGMRGERRNGRNQGGGGRNSRQGEGGFGAAPSSLQQQQFPGFGGATADVNPLANRRTRGSKLRRGPGGDVDGNVAPGYRAGGAGGAAGAGNAGRNTRRGGQQQRNFRNGQPRPAGDGAAQFVDPNVIGVDGAAPNSQPRGNPNNRQRRGRNRQGQGGRQRPPGSEPNSENFNAATSENAGFPRDGGAAFVANDGALSMDGGARTPRPPRNNRGPRRGNNRRPRGAEAGAGNADVGGGNTAPPPTVSSDE
jgi:23S rRNA pseudouridine2605 synthase